jgi:hypothetical protein
VSLVGLADSEAAVKVKAAREAMMVVRAVQEAVKAVVVTVGRIPSVPLLSLTRNLLHCRTRQGGRMEDMVD